MVEKISGHKQNREEEDIRLQLNQMETRYTQVYQADEELQIACNSIGIVTPPRLVELCSFRLSFCHLFYL